MKYAVMLNKDGSPANKVLSIEEAQQKSKDEGKSYAEIIVSQMIQEPPSQFKKLKDKLKEKKLSCKSYKGRFEKVFIPFGMFPALDEEAKKHATVEAATHTYLTFDKHDQWSLGQFSKSSASFRNGDTKTGIERILSLI